jgi:hypothetical protein
MKYIFILSFLWFSFTGHSQALRNTSFPGRSIYPLRNSKEIIEETKFPVSANTYSVKSANGVQVSAPWIETFENGIASWSLFNSDGAGKSWVITNNMNHTSGGSSCAYHDYGDLNYSEEGWMVSPAIEIPAAGFYALSFWSFNQWPDFYGKNSVLISSGSPVPADGQFVEIWSPKSVANVWDKKILSLDSYAGKTIYIAFKYTGVCQHSWGLDDISVSEVPQKDVEIKTIISPVSSFFPNDKVSVVISNNGQTAIESLNVSCSVNGGTAVSETFTFNPALDFGEIDSVTFSAAVLLSDAVDNKVRVETLLDGDENSANNVDTVTVKKIGTETFEGLTDGWTIYNADSAGSSWYLSNKHNHTDGGILSAFHIFNSHEEGWLISPAIKLPSKGRYSLSFWSFNDDASDYSKGKNSVLISSASSLPLDSDFVEVWKAETVSASWVNNQMDLSAYVGKTIYIAFKYEGDSAHSWYLDDISVKATHYEVVFLTIGGNGSIEATANGNAVTSGDLLATGSKLVFNAVANNGYFASSWKINGVEVAGNTSNTLNIDSLNANVNVTVEFNKTSGLCRMGKLGEALYPNPCTNGFNIDLKGKSAQIFIYDLSGKLILSQFVKGKGYIEVSGIMPGVYFVKINGMYAKLVKK